MKPDEVPRTPVDTTREALWEDVMDWGGGLLADPADEAALKRQVQALIDYEVAAGIAQERARLMEAARKEHDATHSYGEWVDIPIDECERPVCVAMRAYVDGVASTQ